MPYLVDIALSFQTAFLHFVMFYNFFLDVLGKKNTAVNRSLVKWWLRCWGRGSILGELKYLTALGVHFLVSLCLKTMNFTTVWNFPPSCLCGIERSKWSGVGYFPSLKSAWLWYSRFSSVQSYPTLCNLMNHTTPGLSVHHQLPQSIQTHVHWVGNAIQPSHSLSSPSPPALNLSQHQCLCQWVSSSHQMAKVLGFQLQQQSFWWTPRTDLL